MKASTGSIADSCRDWFGDGSTVCTPRQPGVSLARHIPDETQPANWYAACSITRASG
ncbi:conserved hypothetical protein [Stutzerimonas stutzeri DSM 4166]|nr:conserved hypothetical protein [Stutzerimonas stutzeri DSM 4166]